MVSEEDIHPLILDHLNAVIKLDVEGNLISITNHLQSNMAILNKISQGLF